MRQFTGEIGQILRLKRALESGRISPDSRLVRKRQRFADSALPKAARRKGTDMTTNRKPVILLDKGITKIDQACALALLLECIKAKPADVEFRFLDLDEADAIPADAIDLDARKHYWNDLQTPSATEVIARTYGAKGIDGLLEDLGMNNAKGEYEAEAKAKGKGGFLRKGEGAFTLLGQKLNDLKASTTPPREHRLEIIERFVKVGDAMIRRARREVPSEYEGAKANFKEAFPEFEEGFSKKPHHLSGYAFQRFLESPDDLDLIQDEIAWWSGKFDAAANSRKLAEKRVAAMELKTTRIGTLDVATIKGRADEVAKEVFAKYGDLDILVAVKPDGVAILPNFKGVKATNVRKLYALLNHLEPGTWHFEERGTSGSGLLLNGSARRGAVPTVIGRDQERLYDVMSQVWG